MSPRLLLPLLSVVVLVLCLAAPSHAQGVLGFTLRTANAGWSARSVSNVEWYRHPLTATLVNGSTVTWNDRLMIMQGNGEGSQQERSNDSQQHTDSTARQRTAAHGSPPLSLSLSPRRCLAAVCLCVSLGFR